tara:strand:+ start:22010 stop:23209 length:1200 start_codon:yes stop_codon:yes gene_type:complete
MLFGSCYSYAGGWVVGGGQIQSDTDNPWFLNNNKNVRYCIQVDETNFSLKKPQLEMIVERALKFWTRQFAESYYADADFPVGKQVFTYEDCAPSTDLRFQFGVLSLEQLQNLSGIDKKIAMAVRTDYDRVHLRGKGFIYLAPERGPLALDPELMWPKTWSEFDGWTTQLTVVHELGHVFGLSHSDRIPLMRDSYVRFVTTNNFWQHYTLDKVRSDFYLADLFKVRASYNQDTSSKRSGTCWFSIVNPNSPNYAVKPGSWSPAEIRLKKFFHLTINPLCAYYEYSMQDGQYVLDLDFVSKSGDRQKVQLVERKNGQRDIKWEPILKLVLPAEQRVFMDRHGVLSSKDFGMLETSVQFETYFHDPKTNVNRHIVVTITNKDFPILTAELDGYVYSDLIYSN